MEQALIGCKYVDQGNNKWLSPKSTSGSAGVTTVQSVNNPWQLMWTHHASDGALRGAMHDAFDLGVNCSDLTKKEYSELQSKELKAIDPDTGVELDVTVDEYNKQNWSNNQQKQLLPVNTSSNKKVLFSSIDLSNMKLPPRHFIIPDLLPAGTTILASEPKEGKSWLISYFCFSIAAGRTIFGRKTVPQQVLYLSLEDDETTLDERQNIIIEQFGIQDKDRENVLIQLSISKINHGFKDELMNILVQHPKIMFIAIDMLIHIRPEKEGNNPNKADHLVGRTLKDITDLYPKLAILVSHHTNKGDKDTNIGKIAGTNALAGSFDNTFVLNKGTLSLNGRGLRTTYEIELLKDIDGRYTLDASAPPSIANKMNETRREVYEYIEEHSVNNKLVSRKDIILDTGLSATSIDQQLKKLVDANLIKRLNQGKYSL